jgi:hypothetical protein
MGSYLAEQERSLDRKFSCRGRQSISFIIWNQIPWCVIILQSKKRITFMLLIIDKCLMIIKPRPKGRNHIITPWTPWKRWRIILVVVCMSTFLKWIIWLLRFQNYDTIIYAIFWGGGLCDLLRRDSRRYSPHTLQEHILRMFVIGSTTIIIPLCKNDP